MERLDGFIKQKSMILAIFLLIFLGLTTYAYMGFRSSLAIKHRKLAGIFVAFLLLFVGGVFLLWQRQIMGYSNASIPVNLLTGLVTTIILGLFFSFFIFFFEDIIRLLAWVFKSLSKKRIKKFPLRSSASGIASLTLNIITFTLVFYGILFGFTHYKVHRIIFEHESIPESFNGFTIAHLSDMHLGTFGSIGQVEKGLKILQNENADLLLFTGDMVNNISAEALPYIELLKSLDFPYGKFAVLGNHDYAHYAGHLSENDQQTDVQKLLSYISKMGFTVLKNRNKTVNRGKHSIAIAGVENWGIAPFPQYGDLDKALAGISDSDFVILLSHDPSHWNEEIVNHHSIVELTLSGHTHGMQLGIELGNFKWSPVQYRYNNWSGMHHKNGRFLYVNRGFGGIGFPGRIGIRPEITIIELRKQQASSPL